MMAAFQRAAWPSKPLPSSAFGRSWHVPRASTAWLGQQMGAHCSQVWLSSGLPCPTCSLRRCPSGSTVRVAALCFVLYLASASCLSQQSHVSCMHSPCWPTCRLARWIYPAHFGATQLQRAHLQVGLDAQLEQHECKCGLPRCAPHKHAPCGGSCQRWPPC